MLVQLCFVTAFLSSSRTPSQFFHVTCNLEISYNNIVGETYVRKQ